VAADRQALSPEAKLLFLAAAVSPSESALRQSLSGGIDWAELCFLAQHENAASILVRLLDRVGADSNNSGYQQLRQLARLSTMQMLQLEQLLHETLGILARENIDAILLKGAGLAYTAYSSFPDRPMSDIDLLVRSPHAERAWSLLQTHGWTSSGMKIEMDRYSGHQHFPRLVREAGRFPLEIHDALLPEGHPFRFSMDAIWDRARNETVKGQVITIPHPIHQLWHACVHFAWSHAFQWGGWRTFRDVAAIIHRNRIEWPEFLALALESRAATCCFWTLKLARRLAGAAVPDAVLGSLRPRYPQFILNRLEGHLLASLFPSDYRCPSVRLTRRLWEAAIAPRWSGHGSSRPFHVTERWVQTAKQPDQEPRVGVTLSDRFRKMRAGVTYLLRVSRMSLPGDLAQPL
jgi:hypothetical protein